MLKVKVPVILSGTEGFPAHRDAHYVLTGIVLNMKLIILTQQHIHPHIKFFYLTSVPGSRGAPSARCDQQQQWHRQMIMEATGSGSEVCFKMRSVWLVASVTNFVEI
jgi:hypothetical protein